MVHARQSQPHRPDKSRNLQRRLYLAAKRSRNRRFHALFDRIVRPDVLWRAWEEVQLRTSIPRDDVVNGLARRRVNVVGKPYEGIPHVRFDVAGSGNQPSGPGATS
jgi:hypothetical protein